MLGVYIHIPFCRRRCNYCDFCSSVASRSAIGEYVAALIKSIDAFGENGIPADTVYLGGGTPSLLTGTEMSAILDAVRKKFRLTPDCEITTEANPCTVTLDLLKEYRASGINRISFGIQSCKADELNILGRLHTFEDAEEAVQNARLSGIENISADLMLGIPKQTPESLRESIDRITSLGVTHISAYMLKIEPNTPFDCDGIRAMLPDDDTVSDMYLDTVQTLSEKGFAQYEISNFSKPDHESRHNLKYWTVEPYIGFGPSAHSYMNGRRFYVPDDIGAFVSNPLTPPETEDADPDVLEEYIMLGMRLCKGISLNKVADLGGDPTALMTAAKPFERAGLLTITGDTIALTPRGFLVSNGMISKLLDSIL